MRLFAYYITHTFINTIKKLFKTWIAIVLIMTVSAGIVGAIIGRLVPVIIHSVKGEEITSEITSEVTQEDGEDEVKEVLIEAKIPSFLAERNLTKLDMLDLLVTVFFLFMVTACLASVNKGGQIFKPADVPILFSSPMKPQSVMLFRVVNSLIGTIFISFYMLFQVPNLMNSFKISVWAAFVIILAYMLSLMFATLVQVGVYTIGCSTKKGRVNIGAILLTFYGVLIGAYILFTSVTHADFITGVFRFLGSKKTFWIPFLGWIRGMIYYAIDGNIAWSALYLGLFIAGIVACVILIWNLRVDFYENAMMETEKVAAQMEKAVTTSKGGVAKREKNRSDKIERDGFRFGSGASVFFYKAVYNRLRFAKLKLFTVTFVIYLLTAIGAGYLATQLPESKIPIDLLFIPATLMAGIAFYRSLGNPLEEDTLKEFFVLIPEPPVKKIWASLLGAVAVCAIDVTIPLIVAAVIVKSNPLGVIAWLVFILAVYLFATSVGAFVSLSVPGETAQTIKAMVQMMFVFFGIIPVITIAAVGIIFGHVEIVLFIGSAFLVGIGAVFAFFAPKFLENR